MRSCWSSATTFRNSMMYGCWMKFSVEFGHTMMYGCWMKFSMELGRTELFRSISGTASALPDVKGQSSYSPEQTFRLWYCERAARREGSELL